jgi:predicted ATPase
MSAVGDLRMALTHTGEGLARYNHKEQHRLTFVYGGHDPGACARNVNAAMLCVLGYPEQAQRQSQAALALAQELAHPNTLALGYFFALLVALLVRDLTKVEQLASDLGELVRSGRAPEGFSADAESFHGWILAERGSVEQGLALMRKTWQGWNSWSFPQGACMAGVLGKVGRAGEGLELLDQALHAAARGGAHWYDAELHRIRADLRCAMDAAGWIEAEKDLEKSIETARAQHARYFELRAATDLARLWVERGQRKKAHDLLAPILNWFTEGLDTPDLMAARACLSAIAA